jgi:hypothetical protein
MSLHERKKGLGVDSPLGVAVSRPTTVIEFDDGGWWMVGETIQGPFATRTLAAAAAPSA